MGGDIFTWDMFDARMERLLENVAKKEDFYELQKNLDEVKKENESLRVDVEHLKTKMEWMDKNMRRSNVVFSGVNCINSTAAKTKIIDICNNTLQVNVNIVRVVMLKAKEDFLVELASIQEAINIITNGKKLIDSGIYVQRDYTANERKKRFELRQLKKEIQRFNKNTSFKFKNTSLFINDKQFDWHEGKIMAGNAEDKVNLSLLLAKSQINYDIMVKQKNSQKNGDQF